MFYRLVRQYKNHLPSLISQDGLTLAALFFCGLVNFDDLICWAGLGWAGLGWAGLGWAGLGWAGLGWAGLGECCAQTMSVLTMNLNVIFLNTT